jgi:hypothetical protein
MNWIWLKNQFILTQRNPKIKGPYLTGVIDTLLSSQRTHAHHHQPHIHVVRSGASSSHILPGPTRGVNPLDPVWVALPSDLLWECFPRRLRQALASCSVRQRESYAPMAVKSNRLVRGLTCARRHCPCVCRQQASPSAAATT